MDRISVGSMSKKEEKGTKGMYVFDYYTSLEQDKSQEKVVKPKNYIDLNDGTPLWIRSVDDNIDLVFTNDGLNVVDNSKKSKKDITRVVCTIDALKEAVMRGGSKQDDKSTLVDLIDGGKSKKDFDATVVGFEDGNIYLSLVRERKITLPSHEVRVDYLQLGLFYLRFKGDNSPTDFSVLEEIVHMHRWNPTTIRIQKGEKIKGRRCHNLYLTEGCNIRVIKVNGTEPLEEKPFIFNGNHPCSEYRILDFDVLSGDKTYIAATIEHIETQKVSVHIIGPSEKEEAYAAYTPKQWIGHNSIRPLSVKLHKVKRGNLEKDKADEDKLYCIVGCYEGDMVILEYRLDGNQLSEPQEKVKHCFLSEDDIQHISSINAKRYAIKQIQVTKDDKVLFSFANNVIKVNSFKWLLEHPVRYYNKPKKEDYEKSKGESKRKDEEQNEIVHFGAPHMITSFDYYKKAG